MASSARPRNQATSASTEPWLIRAARQHGERPALLIPGGGSESYRELYSRAAGLAGGLRAAGIGPGDQVALALPSRELVGALHACTLIGAVAVPIDLRLSPAEQAERARHADLLLAEPPEGPAVEPTVRAPEETATLMFTSGTTSGPKPVELSYENWLWNALGSALALGLDPAERWLCPMPLVHVGGLSIQIRSAVYGTAVLLYERFDTDAVLAALQDPDQRVTLVSLVPTMLGRLLEAGLRAPPSLRWALLGGGPIPPSLLDAAREAQVPVAPSYGMTEACSQIATHGWPLLGTEVEIAEDGEVLVRGRTVATGALSEDGWLHTGDLGRLDPDGRLEIVGRRADTIISGGENVAPAEVEQVLLAHPGVADAAVFGREDPHWGEVVTARVVLRAGPPVSSEELSAHCAGQLAGFKVPKRIEFADRVPRGPTGKLLRRQLA